MLITYIYKYNSNLCDGPTVSDHFHGHHRQFPIVSWLDDYFTFHMV